MYHSTKYLIFNVFTEFTESFAENTIFPKL